MHLPDQWGQGQLFAFSALDGDSFAGDDLCGMLSGDRIGIRFFLKVRRELAFVNLSGKVPVFDCVAGDLIRAQLADERLSIVFAARNLVIGVCEGGVRPVVFTEGDHTLIRENGMEIQDSLNGEYTAIGRKGSLFAFAYAHSCGECAALIEKGLSMDVQEEEKKKLSYFEKYALQENNAHSALFSKCISVMKTQLYSPEAEYKTLWSTPDRLPHKHLWLWDSVFHAVGHRHLHPDVAEDLIRAVWAHQSENGFVPHMADIGLASSITQPPVIAWGAWKVYEKSGNAEFLREAFENNARFLRWIRENRRKSEKELYTWKTTEDVNCRCDECGMDNSPRFDVKKPLFAIDLTCFMANDVRVMAKIARELKLSEEAEAYDAWFEAIRRDINACLWSEEDGFYFDFVIDEGRLNKVWSVASFLPLFSGVCSPAQAERLVSHITNPETFGTEMPVPSISKKDPTFGTDMWRGPVWINYNKMISEGLEEYGYPAISEKIIAKTIECMEKWYRITGTIFEFYDCENAASPKTLTRKGPVFEPYSIDVRMQSIRDYGWSCTLLVDMLMERFVHARN